MYALGLTPCKTATNESEIESPRADPNRYPAHYRSRENDERPSRVIHEEVEGKGDNDPEVLEITQSSQRSKSARAAKVAHLLREQDR